MESKPFEKMALILSQFRKVCEKRKLKINVGKRKMMRREMELEVTH